MSAPWPAGLPQKPIPSDWNEEEPDNCIRQTMETGPPKSRPRTSAKGEEIDLVFSFVGSQKSTFRTFWRETLAFGSLPYEWTHPDTGVVQDFVIMSTPKYKFAGGQIESVWLCSFRVYVKP